MKIKHLSLLLIFAGIIISAGCIDNGAQPPDSKAPESLYKSIFNPYGDTNHQDLGSSGPGLPEANPDYIPDRYSPQSLGKDYANGMSDAIFLLDRNIEKAETISARLEEGIKYYKAEGKDVSKLEALLVKYNLLIEDAIKYRALADAAISGKNNNTITISDMENSSSESARREYLVRSQGCMIQANFVLKEMFDEFQRIMPGSEEINSTSKLSAAGDGKIYLLGNFTLSLHIEKGDIATPGPSLDRMMNVTGNYYVFEKKTGMQDAVMLVYHIYSADVKSSGSNKTLWIRGSNIILNAADGEGYVAFWGKGKYRIENKGGIIKEQIWANPFPGKE